MEEYVELSKGRRDCGKDMFKIVGRIYRRAKNGISTLEQDLAIIDRQVALGKERGACHE